MLAKDGEAAKRVRKHIRFCHICRGWRPDSPSERSAQAHTLCKPHKQKESPSPQDKAEILFLPAENNGISSKNLHRSAYFFENALIFARKYCIMILCEENRSFRMLFSIRRHTRRSRCAFVRAVKRSVPSLPSGYAETLMKNFIRFPKLHSISKKGD